MLIEIASLIIINTTEIKGVVDVNNYNRSSSHSIVGGDSQFQIAERERIAKEKADETNRIYEALQRRTIARDRAERTSGTSTYQSTGNNPYPWGWCTWFVAQKKGITQKWGDAKNWPVNSQVPQEGAIIVTYESWLGHVGVVYPIEGYIVRIEEMNYAGWGKISERVVDYRTLPLKGFLVI